MMKSGKADQFDFDKNPSRVAPAPISEVEEKKSEEKTEDVSTRNARRQSSGEKQAEAAGALDATASFRAASGVMCGATFVDEVRRR